MKKMIRNFNATPMHLGIGLMFLIIPTILSYRFHGLLRYIFLFILLCSLVMIYLSFEEFGVGVIIIFISSIVAIVIKSFLIISLCSIITTFTYFVLEKMIIESFEQVSYPDKIKFRRWIAPFMVAFIVIPAILFALSDRWFEWLGYGFLIIVGFFIGSFLPLTKASDVSDLKI